MRGKATPSNPKFYRRTSGSPWDNSKVTLIPENNNLLLEAKTITNLSKNQLTTSQTVKEKILESSFVKLSNTEKMSTIVPPENNDHSKPTNYPSRGSSQRIFRRDSDEMKMTYIPLESVSTIESASHPKKKANETEEVALETNRLLEISKIKEELSKMIKEKKDLIEDQKMKRESIVELSNEIAKEKNENEGLKKELKEIREELFSIKKELENSKNIENCLKNELKENKDEKLKLGETIQLLTKNINRNESSLKNLKEENVELIKIIEERKRLEQPVSKIMKIGSENKPHQSQVLQVKISSGDYENYMNTNRESNEGKAEIGKQIIKKCSRFIQTENNKLEELVKENEGLSKSVANSLGTEKRLRYQIGEMEQRIRNGNYLIEKYEESERLISILNSHIMAQGLTQLADKYKNVRKY